MAKTYDININLNVDKTELENASKDLKDLEGEQVDVDVNANDSEVKTVKKEVDDLKGEKVDVDVDVDTTQIKNARKEIDSLASSVQSQMSSTGSAVTGLVAGLAGKSIWDTIYGTSAKAETNKILLKNMADTKTSAETLYTTIDKTTDASLVSMQELIPALNGIKAATGANASEVNKITPGVAQFGQYVLALTGSSAKAETAMFDLSKGIKGAYASLDQYGITEDALMRTKLWSGKANDVEGYIAAVNAVTGSTDELMGTAQGMEALLGKTFSRAGKRIGESVLPVVKDILSGFNDLDASTKGWASTAVLAGGGIVSALTMGFSVIGQTAGGLRAVRDAVKVLRAEETIWAGIKALLTGATAAETAATETSTLAWLGLGAAEEFALWPVLAIVAAVALLGLAFYKIGEWLGWWNDLGSMIDSIRAGVTRLWNAFVNSKVVQAYIGMVKAEFNMLYGFIKPILDWLSDTWNSIFGEAGGSAPDAIGAIISAFTVLDNVLSGIINTITAVMTGEMSLYDAVVLVGQNIANYSMAFWGMIGNLVMTGLTNLLSMVATGLLNVFNRVTQWKLSLANQARATITSFITSIISGLASLPGRFGSALQNVISTVVTWGSQLVQKAVQIVTNFANTIANGVRNALNNIPGVDMGFTGDAGFDYGFDGNNTLNNSLSKTVSNNTSRVINNFSINGIVEESASEYIVKAVNDNIRKQNLIRGV